MDSGKVNKKGRKFFPGYQNAENQPATFALLAGTPVLF
jgi:hypothetical protein